MAAPPARERPGETSGSPASQPAPAADGIRVLRVRTPEELALCHRVRAEVFIGEQGVSRAEERDGRDEAPGTVHVLAVTATGEPVGTARLLAGEGEDGTAVPTVHIGRVAVRASLRGQSIGRRLMAAAEDIALAEYGRLIGGERLVRVALSAQETALGFYMQLDYRIGTERYLDAKIWHRDAERILRE